MKKSSVIDPNALFAGVDEMPVALDHKYEEERAEEERRKNGQFEEPWDWDGSLEGLKSLPLSLKIHLLLALLISVGVFIAFRYVASPTPSSATPWWLIPWFFFSITVVGHFFFLHTDYYKGALIMTLILTVGLYIVNKIFTPEFDWYLIPLSVALMIGIAFYLGGENASLVKIITYEYFVLSLLCLVIWANIQSLWTRFPWFVYPICTFGLILAIWNMWSAYRIRKFYLYSLVAGVSLTLQSLFTWAFMPPSDSSWPWWLLVLGFFGLLTVGLYIYTEGCYLFPPAPEGGEPPQQPVNASGDPVQAQPPQNESLTGFLAKKAVESLFSKFTN